MLRSPLLGSGHSSSQLELRGTVTGSAAGLVQAARSTNIQKCSHWLCQRLSASELRFMSSKWCSKHTKVVRRKALDKAATAKLLRGYRQSEDVLSTCFRRKTYLCTQTFLIKSLHITMQAYSFLFPPKWFFCKTQAFSCSAVYIKASQYTQSTKLYLLS